MFAVWSYVIAKMRPDDKVGAQVDLNATLLACILGEKESVVEEVIQKLCAPDLKSRSKEEEGKRLVQVGTFSYRVVNGAAYMAIRNENERREYNRKKKQEERAAAKRPKKTNGESGRGDLVDGKNMENPSWRQA